MVKSKCPTCEEAVMDWRAKRCFVLDMDGTVYLGDRPIAGAVAFIREHWEQFDFIFLSNNTSKAPESYVKKLRGMGIAATVERILAPTTPLVHWLRQERISRVYVLGNADFCGDLARRMPELAQAQSHAEPDVQAVVLAYDTELTYKKLCHAALLLQNPSVRFVATHPDLVCPSPEGPLPDVGSLLALFKTATGREPERIFGKPHPAVLAPLLARYTPQEMVMVGDRLSTDKKLAENAGMDCIVVLSGEATREDVHKEARQPALVLEDLGQLSRM